MRVLLAIWEATISLLVDDGFLAIASLVAIGATWVALQAEVLEASNAMGWMLFALLTTGVVISANRAVRAHIAEPD